MIDTEIDPGCRNTWLGPACKDGWYIDGAFANGAYGDIVDNEMGSEGMWQTWRWSL